MDVNERGLRRVSTHLEHPSDSTTAAGAAPRRREPADGDGHSEPGRFEELAVAVAVHANDAVVSAAGDLDAAGGLQLHAAAEQVIEAHCRRVVLDLSAITSADLAGVRALAEVGVMLERAGIDLTIRNANAAMYPVDWHAVPHSQEYEPHAGRPKVPSATSDPARSAADPGTAGR